MPNKAKKTDASDAPDPNPQAGQEPPAKTREKRESVTAVAPAKTTSSAQPNEAENLHKGHRERLKMKFLTKGLDALEPHEILEMLLFYAVPRQNTNEMAHRLIKRWGSLHQVLDAPYHDLMQEKGIKQNAATLLTFIAQMSQYYHEKKGADESGVYDSVEKLGDYFVRKYIGATRETVLLLSLGLDEKELSCNQIGIGGLSSSHLHIREMVERAIQSRATHVVLAHNHPGGTTAPSNDDIIATAYLKNAFATVDIVLTDHIIVANRQYVSLKQMGYLS